MDTGKPKAAVRAVTGQPGRWKAVELAAIVAVLVFWLAPAVRSGGPEEPNFPANGPAEFLYLDSARVIAYLAQFNGGIFTSEQLTQKLSQSVNGKAAVGVLELGGSSAQEETVARQITPTAAANYIDLLSKLEDLDEGLKTIGLGRFEQEVRHLTEGQFVVFRTHSLTPPVYLNSYLALRDKRTIATLFPMPPDRAGQEQALRDRALAQRFRDQVGQDPRVVFALRPLNNDERAEEERVQYLMPMDAQLLTRERSLLKYGGGKFTVVGKLVRIFPEPGRGHLPAYVDSPTVETWAQPLSAAPLKLLCRTDSTCTAQVRARGVTQRERAKAIRSSRRRAVDALAEQTTIARRGAVILPIAIYK